MPSDRRPPCLTTRFPAVHLGGQKPPPELHHPDLAAGQAAKGPDDLDLPPDVPSVARQEVADRRCRHPRLAGDGRRRNALSPEERPDSGGVVDGPRGAAHAERGMREFPENLRRMATCHFGDGLLESWVPAMATQNLRNRRLRHAQAAADLANTAHADLREGEQHYMLDYPAAWRYCD